eukprot:Gb_35868 [translate_table: standard]
MGEASKKNPLLKSAVEALSKGSHEEAVRFCKQLIKQDRKNYDAHVVLGKALFSGKQYDKAEVPYRLATNLNPTSLRAWQGLVELHEALGEFEKVVDACESIIQIAQTTDDKVRQIDYLRRLAIAHAKSHNPEKASQTWKVLLNSPSISKDLHFEALCGLADAQLIKMDKLRLELSKCYPQKEQPTFWTGKKDMTQPLASLASVPPEDSACSVQDERMLEDTGDSLEKLLRAIIDISPQTQRYQDLLLKHLLGHMQEARSLGGETYRQARLQVLQHSVAMLSSYCSDTAMEVALTMCEEDDVAQIFGMLGMEKSADDRQERLFWLGKRLAHFYPQHGRSLAIIAYAMHCRSIISFSLEHRRSFCERALRMDDSCITGWQVLAELRAEEGSFASAEECVRRGQLAVSHFQNTYGFSLKLAELRLQLVVANALLSSKSYDKSNESFNIIAKSAEELAEVEASRIKFAAIEGQIKVCLAKEQFAEAQCKLEHLLALDANNHWALAELGWLAFQEGSFNDASTLLVQAVNIQPDNASYHYRLGLLYWKAGDHTQTYKEKAVEQFVLSAKLDPSNGDVYRFLGNYYNQISRDTHRASRCYQKSVTLNAEDSEAGEALCDILDGEGRETLEAVMCHEASQTSPRAFWAWRRMGYIQVHQKKWSDAVGYLQHAIRGYPACADLWEALGLAYQRLGMLTAAVKAYGRAITLEGNSRVFSLIEGGNILLLLGTHKKAIDQFRLALEKAPQNLAAQYGLASGLLGMSKECMAMGAFGWGASLAKEASEIAFASAQLFGNVAAVWKLLGDIRVAYAQCLPWEEEGGSFKNERKAFSDSVHSWKQKRLSAAVGAKHAYQHALRLSPWQANLYKDISISVELIECLNGSNTSDQTAWCLSEVLALGGLILESANAEFWVTLGCLSKHKAMQQHAYIRALQVDGSNALAWAHLGKLYIKEGQALLAKQALDRARSSDPLLALSWAGMSVHGHHEGGRVLQESFANCLYAVQLMPVVEFQLGLGMLASSAGQLQLSKVFAAVQQAVQRAPHHPESHNLSGLVWESRWNFQRAIVDYKRARYALELFGGSAQSSSYNYVSHNLARVYCQAGQAKDAVEECVALEKDGMLDNGGLEIYAVALWKLGNNDLALSVAHEAAKKRTNATTLGLLCKLMYHILGQGPAMDEVLNTPKEFLQDLKFSFVAFAIAVLDCNGQLLSFLLHSSHLLFLHERAPVLHSLLAAGEQRTKNKYGPHNGVLHLRKALHMYPQNSLLRNQLGFLLLSGSALKNAHIASRCSCTDLDNAPSVQGSTSTPAMLGVAAIACSDCGASDSRFAFSTCRNQGAVGVQVILQLQRWLHKEPWNYTARYLLVLNIYQKAREKKYPYHLCQIVNRLMSPALSNFPFNTREHISPYKELQLLLCASEISLQRGDYSGSLKHATTASHLEISQGMLFFAHLQLARCYASQRDLPSLHSEYIKCLHLRTGCEIGWIALCVLEARYQLQDQNNSAVANCRLSLDDKGSVQNLWMALLELVRGQSFLWEEDFLSAEKAFAQACSMWPEEGCLYLIHGAICLELARQRSGSQFLSLAVHSLSTAQDVGQFSLPIASVLLAQAETSIGSGKDKCERNIRLEWSVWPKDLRPAEIFFQMHLLAKRSRAMSEGDKDWPESSKSSRSWLLKAVHLNPSCSRYWEIVRQVLKLN